MSDNKLFLVIIGGLAVFVAGPVLRAWAVVTLWGWFMSPLGLPQIGMAHAFGLATLLAYLTYHYTPSSEEDASRMLGGQIAAALVAPLMALGFGWVALQFML